MSLGNFFLKKRGVGGGGGGARGGRALGEGRGGEGII